VSGAVDAESIVGEKLLPGTPLATILSRAGNRPTGEMERRALQTQATKPQRNHAARTPHPSRLKHLHPLRAVPRSYGRSISSGLLF